VAGEPSHWLDVARAAGRFQTEAWRVRKDGTRFWGSVAIDALRDHAGEVIGFANVTREIAPSAALRAVTEERGGSAPLIVESVIDYALYLLDLDGAVQSWNPGAQRIKGYSAHEIIGRNFSIFFTDEEVCSGQPARSLQIARAAGRFEAKGWRVRKDGTRLWASVVIDAVRDPAGEVIGFAKVTRDITQNSALRQVNEDHGSIAQMLVDSVVDYAIYMLDLNGTVNP
jgi:PAS domain S-box-containing protein